MVEIARLTHLRFTFAEDPMMAASETGTSTNGADAATAIIATNDHPDLGDPRSPTLAPEPQTEPEPGPGPEPALDDIDLTIDAGEFAIISGFTGSGKTTLLRHLKPELFPSGERGGSIELFGGPANACLGSTDIGYVPQRTQDVLVAATLRDDLAIRLGNGPTMHGRSWHGRSSVDRSSVDRSAVALQANDIIGFLGIAALIDTPIAALSEGQRQLVCLAAILATRPRLLLLDEPTSGLDAVTRQRTLDLLRRLNRDAGMSIVMAEHRLDGLLDTATHLIAMRRGRIVADGTPREAVTMLHRTQECRDLIPDVPRLFLDARSGAGAMPSARGSDTVTPLPMTVAEGRAALAELPAAVPAHGRASTATEGSSPRRDDDTAVGRHPHSIRTSPVPSATPATTATPALRIHNVSYTYPNAQAPAVRDVSVDARFGQIIAISGQSGSGKSTLLDMLFGTTRPQFGTISLCPEARGGEPMDRPNGRRPGIGDMLRRVFGRPARVRPSRSAGLVGYVPADARAVLELHAGMDPYDLSRQRIMASSLGEQQLAAVRQVLNERRPITLLDEPTKGLDAPASAEVGLAMQRRAAQGGLVIFSCHDPEFCVRYATMNAVLMNGELVAYDTPRAIIARQDYSTTSVHRLLRERDPEALVPEDTGVGP